MPLPTADMEVFAIHVSTRLDERRIVIHAPAKLNLGLEVIGRRDDGFHEIATIFVAIDLYDRVTLSPANDLVLSVDDDTLAGEENLALRALRLLRDETNHRNGARIDLCKRIPAAAGLGGASSDAAATLLGGRELWGLDVSDARLHDLAASLGSDVPFFLRGGCAIGRGRGDRLEPLPVPAQCWFVVAVPEVQIQAKTASLYARLTSDDFSDGSRIAAQAARLMRWSLGSGAADGKPAPVGATPASPEVPATPVEFLDLVSGHLASGQAPDTTLLGNAFARPLYAIAPQLTALPNIMREAGAESVTISGAGPAHYALVADGSQAGGIAARLGERLGDRAQIFIARPVAPRA